MLLMRVLKGGTKMLKKIRHYDHYKGIHVECYTDGYSYNEYDELYLLSAVGFDSTVKGITSAAVSGRETEILSEDEIISVYTNRCEHYRILSAKLPSGLLHQVVAVEGFFTEEGMSTIIYVPEGQNVEELAYHKLQQSYTIPAIPEWAGWLYKKLVESGCVEELKGTMRVLKLNVHEKTLDDLISEGVKNKEISFLERRIEDDVRTGEQCDGLSQGLWGRAC
jgi:hypothetical protein